MGERIKNIIYGLVDPFTNELRYIGKSTSGLARPREHFKPYQVNLQHSHKNNWVKSVISKGSKPIIEILAVVLNKEEIDNIEIRMIKQFRDAGFNLTNGTNGGEGALGRINSKETKEKIRQAQLKYYSNPLHKPINKKKHKLIDNIPHKECACCHQFFKLNEFPSCPSRWDKVGTYCKPCHRKITNKNRNK